MTSRIVRDSRSDVSHLTMRFSERGESDPKSGSTFRFRYSSSALWRRPVDRHVGARARHGPGSPVPAPSIDVRNEVSGLCRRLPESLWRLLRLVFPADFPWQLGDGSYRLLQSRHGPKLLRTELLRDVYPMCPELQDHHFLIQAQYPSRSLHGLTREAPSVSLRLCEDASPVATHFLEASQGPMIE